MGLRGPSARGLNRAGEENSYKGQDKAGVVSIIVELPGEGLKKIHFLLPEIGRR